MQSTDSTIQALRSFFLETFRPDPKVTVSDWADANRILSQVSSPEPGPWRTSRTPYLKEIQDALSVNSGITEVVFMKGSQIGGSEAGLNFVGYLIDSAPGPAMIVQPTELLAKRFVRQRLDRMLIDTEKLHKKVQEKKSRDKKNTAIMKEYDGGLLIISGANSAPSLRSMPIRYLMLDEVDAYPHNVGKEGDPVRLAEVRTRNFAGKKKIFKVSTPTIAGKSRIESAFEQSDQRYFYVPCPFCNFFQKIKWASIHWEPGKPETAHMKCVDCGACVEEFHKNSMLSQGIWVAENPEKGKSVGFHLSALYSPLGWYSWKDAVREFLEAQTEEEKLIVFVNTVLGETWKIKGEAPEWQRIYERRESYPFNVVPKGACLITAGVDVQKDRFEVEIVAWGKNKESWSLDYRTIVADTSNESNYVNLEALLNETFAVEGSKTRLPISLLAIDSGFNTQAVYNFARGKAGRVIAVKGSDTQPSILGKPTAVDVSYGGRRIPRGVHLWPVGVSPAKSELYGWLGIIKPTEDGAPFPPGFCHFPQYSEEYFKMITAEELTIKMVRGYPRYQWVKTRGRNEALDARVYARAAAQAVGIDRFSEKDWNDRIQAIQYNDADDQPKKKAGIPVKKSEFWGD